MGQEWRKNAVADGHAIGELAWDSKIATPSQLRPNMRALLLSAILVVLMVAAALADVPVTGSFSSGLGITSWLQAFQEQSGQVPGIDYHFSVAQNEYREAIISAAGTSSEELTINNWGAQVSYQCWAHNTSCCTSNLNETTPILAQIPTDSEYVFDLTCPILSSKTSDMCAAFTNSSGFVTMGWAYDKEMEAICQTRLGFFVGVALAYDYYDVVKKEPSASVFIPPYRPSFICDSSLSESLELAFQLPMGMLSPLHQKMLFYVST